MKRVVLMSTASAALLALNVPAHAAQPAGVSVSTIPVRVCLDERSSGYLNFDLAVDNRTPESLEVKEVRAFVSSPEGTVTERRILWPPATDLIQPQKTFEAGAQRIIFNPFSFSTAQPGSRIRYEIDFKDLAESPVLTFEPQLCRPNANLILPLEGRVAVLDGYDFLSHHRRVNYSTSGWRKVGVNDNYGRFGLDLLITDVQGSFHRGEGLRNEDWFSWDQPVRAPAAGLIVAVHNSQPDNSEVGSENLWTDRSLSRNEMTAYGNYVLIDHGNGEHSLLSHLREGSVAVRPGEHVRSGHVVGRIGNSGASLMPHLHYELRSGLGVRNVQSLPPYFRSVEVLGSDELETPAGVPINTGDILIAQ